MLRISLVVRLHSCVRGSGKSSTIRLCYVYHWWFVYTHVCVVVVSLVPSVCVTYIIGGSFTLMCAW